MGITAGKDWLLQVDIASSMTTIAGQRGCSLTLEAETIDTTSKDQAAWGQALPGVRRWSIDADHLLIDDDAGYQQLVDAFKASPQTQLTLQIVRPDGKVFKGTGYITSFPHEVNFDDAATISVTFTGNGQPTKFWETP